MPRSKSTITYKKKDSKSAKYYLNEAKNSNDKIIKVGTFDNPSIISPNAHIFTESAVNWIKIPDEVKCYEQFYNFKDAWPREAFERLHEVRKLQNQL